MKKQILFMMFLSLAFVFAGVNKVFAQQPGAQITSYITGASVNCPTVNNVTCGVDTDIPEELRPIAGKEYTYTVNVTPAEGTTYHWFVTNATSFIDATGLITTGADPGSGAGDYIMAVGDIEDYNDPTTADNSIDLKWKSFTDEPVFLVIYSVNETGCADNIEAWKIDPQNAFTLDLANLGEDGTIKADDYLTCVDVVQEAYYDATDEELKMDYGQNYLYYTVSAANYGEAWRLGVNLTTDLPLANGQTVTLDWTYSTQANADDATWYSLGTGAGEHIATDIAVGADAACIVIRVHVDHDAEEMLADADITLAVDGVMMTESTAGGGYDTEQAGDVHYADWTDPTSPYTGDCGTEDGYDNDVANQILKARPDIDESNPAPESFVDKEGQTD